MKAITLFFIFFIVSMTFAQVGINTTSPNAQLDIQSSNVATPTNTDGILIPKVDEYPSTNPTAAQDGMLVYATGNGSIAKGFYYWNNSTTSWVSIVGNSIEKIDDLTDGKSDNDGTNNGSSVFLGLDAGINDDGSNNANSGFGFQALQANTFGYHNTAIGYQALLNNINGIQNTAIGVNAIENNTSGDYNVGIGYNALFDNTTGFDNIAIGNDALANNTLGFRNVAIGKSALFDNGFGDYNVAVGYQAGGNSIGNQSVFLGYQAGYFETDSNRLYIESSATTNPLIYGEFDNNFLRVNGDLEIEKTTNTSATVVTPFGFQSSLKLFERGTSGDFGFEFQYDGTPDRLYLWSRTFAGNEGIRMTWLKDGKVGINDTSPDARLDVEATNRNAPLNTDGILMPRINNFPTANPGSLQDGMLVYLTTDDSFYFWDHGNTNWQKLSKVERINDLIDARSDNDGTNNGSSIYFGIGAGQNDDESNNLNVGIGYQTMNATNSGTANVAIGADAMNSNTTGGNNVAIGINSLENNINGNNNIAIGRDAMNTNSSGDINTVVGPFAMFRNTSGNGNVAIGASALEFNSVGDNNTAIGYTAALPITIFDNTTAIGYNAVPNSPNQVRLGNASVAVIGGYANWSNFSDRRLKTNIQENVVGLDFIKKLRPVSYNYDMDAIAHFEKTPDTLRLRDAELLKSREVQTGFIAQEVEQAAQEVSFDFHGVVKPYDPNGTYALRYAEFVVPLVKAMQEQQTIIEAQNDELSALRKEIEAIKALLGKE